MQKLQAAFIVTDIFIQIKYTFHLLSDRRQIDLGHYIIRISPS